MDFIRLELLRPEPCASTVRRSVQETFRDGACGPGASLRYPQTNSLGRDGVAAAIVVDTERLKQELAWRLDPLPLAHPRLSGEFAIEAALYAMLTQRPHLPPPDGMLRSCDPQDMPTE